MTNSLTIKTLIIQLIYILSLKNLGLVEVKINIRWLTATAPNIGKIIKLHVYYIRFFMEFNGHYHLHIR